jgi:hypothetical protein
VEFSRGGRAAHRAAHSHRSLDVTQQEPPAFVPPHLHAEWTAISYGRRNFLLAGAPSAVDAMLASMLPHLFEPIRLFAPDTEGSVPLPTEGTLILMEIGLLNGNQQSELVAWLDQLDRRDPVQIVSTTTGQILPLVESGKFRAELYYRLNVIRIDLSGAGTDHHG